MSAVDELEGTATEPEQDEPAIDPEHGGEREPDPADDDDETPDGTEPDVQDAPPAGPSPEEIEVRFKKVEKAFSTYQRTVERELGDLADDLTACPLCFDTPAGFVRVGAIGTFPQEIVQTVEMFLGKTLEAEYVESKDYQPCPECNALGKVRTGSKVPNQETLLCPRCQGRGFVSLAPAGQNGHADTPAALAAIPPPADARVIEDADAWGSPRLLPSGLENPNYGRMPQYKTPEYP